MKMKAKCIAPDHGYEHVLKKDKMYEITDIQDGIFASDYYIIGIGEDGNKFSCHLHRFDITQEQAEEYVLEHHLDWRKEAVFPSRTYDGETNGQL